MYRAGCERQDYRYAGECASESVKGKRARPHSDDVHVARELVGTKNTRIDGAAVAAIMPHSPLLLLNIRLGD